jgi:hypothetical protein
MSISRKEKPINVHAYDEVLVEQIVVNEEVCKKEESGKTIERKVLEEILMILL